MADASGSSTATKPVKESKAKFKLVTSLPTTPNRPGRPAPQEVLDYVEALREGTTKRQPIMVEIANKEDELTKHRNWIRSAAKRLDIEVSMGFWPDAKNANKGSLYAAEKSVYKERMPKAS